MSSTANLYPAPGAAPVTSFDQHPAAASAPISAANASVAAAQTGKLAAFEGFLKKAGHIAGVVLTDIVKYIIPVASVVSLADPAAAPAVEAFTASVKLVQAAVISIQQKWSSGGPEVNSQKLADVLAIVEQPVLTMFAQAGMKVDTAYVVNLVNGVVAILNAQPGVILPQAA